MANKMKYREAWRWPQAVEGFIRSRAQGLTIHVCSGMSQIGDVRIDIDGHNANVRGDFNQLPVKDDIADTVVCDPPWELQYHLRGKLVKELRRIIKPGGQLLFLAPWSPKQPGLIVESIMVPEYQLMWFSNIALCWICRKVRGLLL